MSLIHPAGAKEGDGAPSAELHSLEQHVITFLNSKDFLRDDKKLPTVPQKQNTPKIIKGFTNRKHKIEMLMLTKTLRSKQK